MLQSSSLIGIIVSIGITYFLSLSIYRVFFSRISHIPGPTLAALTYYYQAYYDIWPHKGQFMFHCIEIHARYGPVIRIGPDEVHVNDVNYYNDIYTNNSRPRDKSPLWFYMSGIDAMVGRSTFATLDHDLHRLRRGAFGQYFSRSRVLDLQPMIYGKVEQLKNALLRRKESGMLINLRDACSALTLEVITEYTLGNSIAVIDSDDFAKAWNEQFFLGVQIHPIGRAFPWLVRRLVSLPEWMMRGNTQWQTQQSFEKLLTKLVTAAVDDSTSGKSKHFTVLHEMINYEALPPEERSFSRMKNEAGVFIGAGTETTGRTLAITLFHILSNKEVYTRLRKELFTIMPTSDTVPTLPELEKLAYLTAVLYEGLRIAHAGAGRHARIAPKEDLIIHGFTIPRGVTISESHYLIHADPDNYPDPFTFDPERWIGAQAKQSMRSFVQFGRGARMCVGMNLAWAELYFTIAVLIRCLDMELVDTTLRDVTVVAEYFLGSPPPDSKGVRIRVLGEYE